MTRTTNSGRRAIAAGAAVSILVLAGCASASGGPASPAGEHRHVKEQTARKVLQVAGPRENPTGTLLEGPTFGDDGRLHLTDYAARLSTRVPTSRNHVSPTRFESIPAQALLGEESEMIK
ncbi:hypothetical protein [Saccharomonospora sp.]|uniref:hypothetical protein n=1 Tax=Saccharomonospora sp. TaxID=33913 RepID=UPI0026380687|nr:hypothetical protein [Saccharomonospora sp.]